MAPKLHKEDCGLTKDRKSDQKFENRNGDTSPDARLARKQHHKG